MYPKVERRENDQGFKEGGQCKHSQAVGWETTETSIEVTEGLIVDTIQ